MRSGIRFLVLAGFLTSLTVLAGCSSSGTISGKVSYQGRPLTGGTVLFTSTEGRGTKTAQIGADGSYSIEKMPAGPAKIAVETKSTQPPPGKFGSGPPANMQPPKGVELPAGAQSSVYGTAAKKPPAEVIPAQYGDPDKSDLTYKVTGGPQTHNIELK
jgi:hypothetical protein